MADGYDYTEEMQAVLKCLRDVQKTYRLRNTYRGAIKPEHAPALRRAYVVAMKVDLLNLHDAIERLIMNGMELVRGEEGVTDDPST